MTLWSLSHFCAGEIKILIVQYAVITEQTCSPRGLSRTSLAIEIQNLRCNSLFFLSFSVGASFLSFFSCFSLPIIFSSLYFALLSTTFTRIAEVVEVRTTNSALHDWTSFQDGGGSFACWNKREREREIFFLDGAGIIFVDYEPRNLCSSLEGVPEIKGNEDVESSRTGQVK